MSTTYGDITKRVIKGVDDIRWGIDIRGGVDVTFSPPRASARPKKKWRRPSRSFRCGSCRRTSPTASLHRLRQQPHHRAVPVEGRGNEFNPEKAISELGATANLTFREYAYTDTQGKPAGDTLNNIVIEARTSSRHRRLHAGFGRDEKAYGGAQAQGGRQAEVLRRHCKLIGNPISIWMDETLISAPTVQAHITDGVATISGNFRRRGAPCAGQQNQRRRAPFAMVTENYNTISRRWAWEPRTPW